MDGALVWNLFTRYRWDANREFSLRVENLTDERYYGVRFNTSSKYLSPQPARLVSAGVRFRF